MWKTHERPAGYFCSFWILAVLRSTTFLASISSPADGRLRQLVANALRSPRDKERLAAHLIAWQEIETDEFTHRAIARALDGLDLRSAGQTALALEVARLTTAIGREMAQRERLNRELEIAKEVQEYLFPQRLPSVAGPGLLWAMPAGAGGRRGLL